MRRAASVDKSWLLCPTLTDCCNLSFTSFYVTYL